MDIGTLLLMVGLAYGLGVLWYDLLPASVPDRVWRIAAYPFLGIFVAEALLSPILTFDPKFGGIHLITALIGSLVAVDWAITEVRHPAAAAWPHPRPA
jgi:hypothetical protein